MRFLYTLLIYLLTPALLLYFLFRGLSDRRWLRRWGERFGNAHTTFSVRGIVVHAASVGEVNAAAPLIQSIRHRWPGFPLTITCFTPTGSERIRSLFGDEVHHVYVPIDLPGATWRFLRNLEPRLLVVMETEIWPNLYQQTHSRGIPILISNARLTPESARGWSRFSRLASAALRSVNLIAAQTAADRERFITLGADPDTTRVLGNLKFEIDLEPGLPARGHALREEWGADRTVLVAGSTHEDDEAALFDALGKVLKRNSRAMLVMAPRYPERFSRAAEAASASGLRVGKLSEGPDLSKTECLVVDRMGLLLDYYAAADIAFIGGTLAQVGGHNPLEAAALGRPLILGPHCGHIEQLSGLLLQSGAAIRVNDSDELFTAWMTLLDDTGKRNEMGKAARLLLEQERGALAKNLQAVGALLAER